MLSQCNLLVGQAPSSSRNADTSRRLKKSGLGIDYGAEGPAEFRQLLVSSIGN